MKKKPFAMILAAIMACSLTATAFAAPLEATDAANALNAAGLFDGTGTDKNNNPIYDLDRPSTRQEAVTMLVRLLGKGPEALSGNWDIPFTDVSNWAKPYVGYAYANGLASGTSKTTFGGNDKVTAPQYLTFVLRALGYESGIDFTWNKAWELSDAIGLTDGRYDQNTTRFLRSDIAIISANALNKHPKNTNKTLFENMKNNGCLKSDASLEVITENLSFAYCDDKGNSMHYKEKLVQSASVTKIGHRYQFTFELMPDHFEKVNFFPAGYNNEDGSNKHVVIIPLTEQEEKNTVTFSVSEEFIFRNPINTKRMIFRMNPIDGAFPENFPFAKGCTSDCILVKIETSRLPR